MARLVLFYPIDLPIIILQPAAKPTGIMKVNRPILRMIVYAPAAVAPM